MTALFAILTSGGAKFASVMMLVGSGLLVIWRVLATAKNAGRREAEQHQLEREMTDAKAARDASADVAGLGNSAVLDELHRDFDRK